MTKRQSAPPAPGPVEIQAREFDAHFGKVNPRAAFRRELDGLLLPAERTKPLTALANAEPSVGAQEPAVQALPWLRSESPWDVQAVNQRRLELLRADPATAPAAAGVLVIDETGERTWGSKTAPVGRQELGSRGKVDTGVVSVTSLWADASVDQPLAVEPFTPTQHFPRGMADPAERTKPQIAVDLVRQAVADGLPFRAVVAASFDGENDTFRTGLARLGVGDVLALKPSPAWWAPVGTVTSLAEAARAASWDGTDAPGAWQPLERTFRDGHTDTWWVWEVTVGPSGPTTRQRAVVATTDPTTLPELTTWQLVTNLLVPGDSGRPGGTRAPADLAESVRLDGLRKWVEQSQEQGKGARGWNAYPVRKDQAIRRPWALVCCAFACCWWADSRDRPGDDTRPPSSTAAEQPAPAGGKSAPRAALTADAPSAPVVAGGAAPDPGLAGAGDPARTLLARLVGAAPTPTAASPAQLGRAGPAHRPL